MELDWPTNERKAPSSSWHLAVNAVKVMEAPSVPRQGRQGRWLPALPRLRLRRQGRRLPALPRLRLRRQGRRLRALPELRLRQQGKAAPQGLAPQGDVQQGCFPTGAARQQRGLKEQRITSFIFVIPLAQSPRLTVVLLCRVYSTVSITTQ